jgi:hypothetical protein
MSERAPESRSTIVESEVVTRHLGRAFIDAALLDWWVSSHAAPDSFGPAYAPTTATNGAPMYVHTAARKEPDGTVTFKSYPPALLIYTEAEVEAFIAGVRAGEFDNE